MFIVRDLKIPDGDHGRHEDMDAAIQQAKGLVQAKREKARGWADGNLAEELDERIHVIVFEKRHMCLGEWDVSATRVVWDSRK